MDQPKLERLLRLMKMLTANVEYSVDDIADKITKACALPVNAHRHSKMIMTFTEAMKNMEKEINRKVLKVFHVICH